MTRDLRTVKRDQESLSQQCEDKENTIFKLKKDLRSMKEQFNEEKIRHRRSQVMQSRTAQSRIPPPSTTTRGTRKSPYSSSLVRPSSRVKKTGESTTSPTDTKNGDDDESNVARIRFRVLKLLQKHDPLKVQKVDTVMASFKGRETELLEKMINRYEKKEEGATTPVEATATTPLSSSNEGGSPPAARPMSRQDQALARHLKRMERIRASGNKGK